MKKIITLLGLLTTVSLSQAQNVTNLAPNGTFSTSSTVTNPSPEWVEVPPGGTVSWSYPTTGGNPGDYGVMDATSGGWGIWVGGDASNPVKYIPIATLGLTAGQPAIFLQDMIVLPSTNSAGTNLGGVKIEFFSGPPESPTQILPNTGDKYPTSADKAGKILTNWNTYALSVNVPFGTEGIRIVPLWGPNSRVGFDNFRAVYSPIVPLTAEISSPPDGALRPTDFLITANASVSPGTVSSVTLYDGPTLVSTLATAPYEWLVSNFAVGNHPLTVVATSSGGASVTSSVVNVTVSTEVNVTVDPTKSWLGYMNVLESPANPTNSLGFVYGSGWATADLRAAFCGTKLILSPNTINDPAPFWYVTTNSPSIGNKTMNANFYVEPAGSLPGQLVTFSGTVQSSTLLSALNPTNEGWTVVAFIKDFAPDYSAFSPAYFPITGNGAFTVQLQTSFNAGNHVQYGFEVQGPCVWPTDPALAGYGDVQIELSSPVLPAAPTITSTLSGGTLNLAFPTEGCYAYTVLVKTNLTDLTWSTLTVTNGTGATAVVSTPASGGSRFFRVSAQ